jgi:FMN phosphatase YigB (HAD superfamily)
MHSEGQGSDAWTDFNASHLYDTEQPVPRVQGIKELIGALQARGIAVYLISGGFRELTLPIARELGVPFENVFANRMNWCGSCHTAASCNRCCLLAQNLGP